MQALRIFENPETTSPLVQKLLAHWGGGSVLLGTGDGNLAILVSACAQPLRPWALGAAGGAGPAEEFLPGQLLLRRGESSWVARLTEGLMFSAVQNFLVGQNGKVLSMPKLLLILIQTDEPQQVIKSIKLMYTNTWTSID